jgi:hypothetical protein
MNQYPLLAYISLFSPSIPIITGIIRLDLRKLERNILLLFLISTFAIDLIAFMSFIKDYRINLGLMHAYVFIEFLFIMFLISFWQESKNVKKMFQVIYLLYILFWIFAKLSFEPFNGIYSLTTTVSQVILALAAGYTLFVVIGNSTQPLFNLQRFWILLSFVLYYTGTLMFYALQGILVHYSREDIFLVASINWSLKILFNILLAIGFLCPQTRR